MGHDTRESLIARSLASSSEADKHDTETHIERFEQLNDLVHEGCVRLEILLRQVASDILQEELLVGILNHDTWEEILHNSNEER